MVRLGPPVDWPIGGDPGGLSWSQFVKLVKTNFFCIWLWMSLDPDKVPNLPTPQVIEMLLTFMTSRKRGMSFLKQGPYAVWVWEIWIVYPIEWRLSDKVKGSLQLLSIQHHRWTETCALVRCCLLRKTDFGNKSSPWGVLLPYISMDIHLGSTANSLSRICLWMIRFGEPVLSLKCCNMFKEVTHKGRPSVRYEIWRSTVSGKNITSKPVGSNPHSHFPHCTHFDPFWKVVHKDQDVSIPALNVGQWTNIVHASVPPRLLWVNRDHETRWLSLIWFRDLTYSAGGHVGLAIGGQVWPKESEPQAVLEADSIWLTVTIYQTKDGKSVSWSVILQ